MGVDAPSDNFKRIIVFQMEFDKTKWFCSAKNLAELPPSCTHKYNAVFEGHSSQARQNCTQNSARGIKT